MTKKNKSWTASRRSSNTGGPCSFGTGSEARPVQLGLHRHAVQFICKKKIELTAAETAAHQRADLEGEVPLVPFSEDPLAVCGM